MLPIKIQLPANYLDEEVRDGYTVKNDVKKLWAILLDLLNEFMDVCNRNNIRYFACGGTILGAARHKGMIPWDDDIDVMMFREDYEKLCAIADREFKHPYFFQTEHTDHESIRGHAQLRNSLTTGILRDECGLFSFNQGLFLDIFPLDNVPDESNLRYEYICNTKKYKTKLREIRRYHHPPFYHKWSNVFKSVYMYITDNLHYYGFLKQEDLYEAYCSFETYMQKYNSDDCCDVILSPLSNSRYLWPKKLFDGEPIYLPFEMFNIPVPSGYLEMLKITYGQWQKFVIGTSVHGNIIIDPENPFNERINEQ